MLHKHSALLMIVARHSEICRYALVLYRALHDHSLAQLIDIRSKHLLPRRLARRLLVWAFFLLPALQFLLRNQDVYSAFEQIDPDHIAIFDIGDITIQSCFRRSMQDGWTG